MAILRRSRTRHRHDGEEHDHPIHEGKRDDRPIARHEHPVEEDERLEAERLEVVGEEEVVQAYPDPWHLVRGVVYTFTLWIGVAITVIEVLLGFRLGFLLASSNPSNGFVNFIYDRSGPLVEPFDGIFSNRTAGDGVFEPATLLAMIVYLVAALLLVMVLRTATTFPSPAGVTTREHRRARRLTEH